VNDYESWPRAGESRAEIIALERTFPELALAKGQRTFRKGVETARRRTRTMSAAARKAVSARMTKYWAERRKAKARMNDAKDSPAEMSRAEGRVERRSRPIIGYPPSAPTASQFADENLGREKVALTLSVSLNDHRRKRTKKDETICQRTKDRGILSAHFTKRQ
jgi:hypothetical protein